jgi:hypothetical protein
MSDFGDDQLASDWGGVCGSSQSGEAFRSVSTTYYGVFNQADARYTFDLVGSKTDVSMVLIIDRAQGYVPTVNGLLFRAFDSTTYRVNDVRNDQAVFECDLEKPR